MDGMHGGLGPQDDEGGAEQAFDALRVEVAALRGGIEMLYRQVQQVAQQAGQQSGTAAGAGPDYSLTLGKMEQALGSIAGRLAEVERQPALRLTPAGLRTEIDQVATSAAQVVSRPFAETVADARAVTRELKALAGRVHERREQQQWLWTVGSMGAIGGVLLWFMLTAFLPWGGGTGLASLAYGGRWNAGEAMLRDANPAAWNRMVRVSNACPEDSTTELCEAALVVRTMPPLAPQAPSPPADGAKGPTFGTITAAPHSRTGR